ncbi:MAG: hypothetical protein ISS70_13080 [Phycisphaerae bacterium]|nr:hypothetical protein [Phycisphaerae bacterium]
MAKNSRFCLFVILSLCHFTYAEQWVTQFGITWTFDRDYTVGQFANGDYWVVGPVTIIGIGPPSLEIDGRVMNGSMVNPSPTTGGVQGYDNTMYAQYRKYAEGGGYDPRLNIARPNAQELSESNPLVLQAHSSLVSTISVEESGYRPQLKTAAVLTVLDAPAPNGSFRPPYCGNDKTIRFHKDRLNYALLENLTPVSGAPSLTTVERYFERPWLDHIPGWLDSYQHPIDNMPWYSREMATQVGEGAVMLHLNFTRRQKETLLIRYVQLGIDLYGIIQDGGRSNWVNNGGLANGRKWPILFTGLVLNDPNMKNIGRKSGDYLYSGGHGPGNEPGDYIHFGEDDQTFYVTAADVEITHSARWNPDHRDTQKIPYGNEDIGLVEWGIRHSNAPEASNKFWGTAYRLGTTASSWAGSLLATHIMQESASAKTLWNHDALFDYMDRYMQVQRQVARSDIYKRQQSRFLALMWDAYRPEYGPVWTMSPTLNITAVGGSVARNPNSTTCVLGERVVLSVMADAGYEFVGWSGDLTGNESPATIIMHSNQLITAEFKPIANKPICEQ